MDKTIVVLIGALISCALWGSAFPFIKMGYAYLAMDPSDTASILLFAGIRFTIAGVLAIVIGSLLQKKFLYPSKKAVPKVFALSMFQTVLQYLFFYIGLAHASGVNASIIEGLNVFVALLIAAILFRQEKLTIRKTLGCAIGFIGIIIVALSGGSIGGFAINGEGFVFISTIAYAFSSVLIKNFSKTEEPVMMSGWQFVFGGIILMLCGLIGGGKIENMNGPAFAILIWLAFVSAAAYSIWSTLLKYNPVSKVAIYGFMNPVFGVILSAILLHEGDHVGVSAITALILVSIGIYICNSAPRIKQKA